ERTDRMKRVKPAASLIHSFRNEICREGTFEYVLIFEWVVPLRERHGAGVEPNVHQLRNPAHFAAARASDGDGIDIRLVQIQRFRQLCALSAQFFKTSNRTLRVALPAN